MKKLIKITLCTLLVVGSQYFIQAMEGEPGIHESPHSTVDQKAAEAQHQKVLAEHKALMIQQQDILNDTNSTKKQQSDAKTTMKNSKTNLMDSHAKILTASNTGGIDMSNMQSQYTGVNKLNSTTMTHEMSSDNAQIKTTFNPNTGEVLSIQHAIEDVHNVSEKNSGWLTHKTTTIDPTTGTETTITIDPKTGEKTMSTRTTEQIQTDARVNTAITTLESQASAAKTPTEIRDVQNEAADIILEHETTTQKNEAIQEANKNIDTKQSNWFTEFCRFIRDFFTGSKTSIYQVDQDTPTNIKKQSESFQDLPFESNANLEKQDPNLVEDKNISV